MLCFWKRSNKVKDDPVSESVKEKKEDVVSPSMEKPDHENADVNADHIDGAICLEPSATENEAQTLECGHKFHDVCCREWLKKSRSCPMCRKFDDEILVDIRRILKQMVNIKCINEKDAHNQYDAMKEFAKGKLSYAEMRMICG